MEALEKLQRDFREAIGNGDRGKIEDLLPLCEGTEILVELFLAREVFGECCDPIISKCCTRDSAKEAYAFLLEVLSHDDLQWESKRAALPHFQHALLRMESGEQQWQFLLNALHLVRRFLDKGGDENLEALALFGTGFTDMAVHLEPEPIVGALALEDGVACYLLNILPKLLPKVGSYPECKPSFQHCESFSAVFSGIARLARKFIHAPPHYPYAKVDGDGGGLEEATPLARAAFVYFTETTSLGPSWARIPRIFSAQRRYLVLAWVAIVMAKNGFRDIGFHVFMTLMCPLFPFVKEHILDAQFYIVLLEGINNLPDKKCAPAIFSTWSACIRLLPFRRRFETYVTIIKTVKVDILVGGVVTNARNDWWEFLRNPETRKPDSKDQSDQKPALRYIALQLIACTLDGSITIVDGMDTLMAALNFARLLLLSPECSFVLAELCGTENRTYFNKPLDELLGKVSSQVDFELQTAENEPVRERIQMVAHLVARVRELLVDAKTRLNDGSGKPSKVAL